MIQITEATFDNGILRPDNPLDLEPQSRVRLVVEPIQPDKNPSEDDSREAAWKLVRELWQRCSVSSHGEKLTREQLHERR